MRLARVAQGPQAFWAEPVDGGVQRLPEGSWYQHLLEGGSSVPASQEAPVLPEGSFTWLPPLAASATLYCIGLNYKSHVEETARDLPPQPSVFVRTAASVVGHAEPMRRPLASTHFDFEGEVAVVIGRGGRHIAEDRAWNHVAGFTCFNDGSVRDFQKHSVTAGKNFSHSGACGPWIVTRDEIPDADDLQLTTRLNGQVVQQSSTRLLIYPIARLIAYLSTITPLQPGDLIATGTPAGVGARRTPALWMKAGDRIEVDVAGVGVLSNPIADEAKE